MEPSKNTLYLLVFPYAYLIIADDKNHRVLLEQRRVDLVGSEASEDSEVEVQAQTLGVGVWSEE